MVGRGSGFGAAVCLKREAHPNEVPRSLAFVHDPTDSSEAQCGFCEFVQNELGYSFRYGVGHEKMRR